jgi:BirA family biotin operon repressor/biotin-[acetyl-CoA-carboxylase] ligase
MELPKSSSLVAKLVYVSETGSTNSDLISAAVSGSDLDWPDFWFMLTGFQNAGRGRAGREWICTARSSLFVSVLVRQFETPIENLGWLPLLAGLAMSRAVAGRLAASAALGSELAATNLSLSWGQMARMTFW